MVKTKGNPAEPPKRGGSFLSMTPAQIAEETPDTPLGFAEAWPLPGLIVLMGDRGQGKTGGAYGVMDAWHERSKGAINGSVYQASAALRKMLPGWVAAPQTLSKLPHDSVNIIDEAQLVAHARTPGAAGNFELAELAAASRQRNQLNILIVHHSRKLEVLDVMEASRLIWKMPTRGHVMWERKELKVFSARAFSAFEASKGDPRKRAYVMDLQKLRFGFTPSKLPPWWDERMSYNLKEGR